MSEQKPVLVDRKIVIGEKTYTLRYSIMAMAALQEHYGLSSIDEVGHRLSNPKSVGVDDMVAVLWAGLKRHHPDITKKDVMLLMDDMGMSDIQTVLGEAFAAATPETKGGQARTGEQPGP